MTEETETVRAPRRFTLTHVDPMTGAPFGIGTRIVRAAQNPEPVPVETVAEAPSKATVEAAFSEEKIGDPIEGVRVEIDGDTIESDETGAPVLDGDNADEALDGASDAVPSESETDPSETAGPGSTGTQPSADSAKRK